MNVQVDDLVRITEGELITSDNTDKETVGKIVLRNIATDSRKTDEESMFIAFRGENVDGHKFLTSALKNAPAALIEEDFGTEGLADQKPEDGKAYIRSKREDVQPCE